MTQKTQTTKDLIQWDKQYLWHPFTQMQGWQEEEPLMITGSEGCYLIDSAGRRYLDGISSLWCNVHGHRVEAIDQAIREQLDRVAHTTFLGLTHPPAIELAKALIERTPGRLTRVFYSDSGSESVEIALKMAFQYWQQKGRPQKTKFVKLEEAYHGDTLGSVSVGGIELFHKMYRPLLFETFRTPSPHPYRWPGTSNPEEVCREALQALEKLLEEHHDQIAALIMEPLMQGAAGMIRHPDGYLCAARQLTERYDILLILDEVATGFGRTGSFFACEKERVEPDLMSVAKGITGGYLPLAATLASEEIYSAFLGKYEEFKTFFHGHTYTANPLCCRAALASLRLFDENSLMDRVRERANQMAEGLRKIAELPIVGDVRQAGLMAGIELVKNRKTRASFEAIEQVGAQVIQEARKQGVIVRPLGPVVVWMPPLAISEEQMQSLIEVTYQSIQKVQERYGI